MNTFDYVAYQQSGLLFLGRLAFSLAFYQPQALFHKMSAHSFPPSTKTLHSKTPQPGSIFSKLRASFFEKSVAQHFVFLCLIFEIAAEYNVTISNISNISIYSAMLPPGWIVSWKLAAAKPAMS